MTDRVEALAGSLQILSSPTLGTRVTGRIPL
jgi:signal transduction histidine kinase